MTKNIRISLFILAPIILWMASGFFVKDKTEKHYVFMGRVFTVLLMIISAFFALFLNNSLQAFGIILQIGAGTGLIFILRWFWYRINVYSELTAMIVSFVVALAFEFVIPNNFSVEEKLIIGVTITTISWLVVTMITPPSNMETLQNFYKKHYNQIPFYILLVHF